MQTKTNTTWRKRFRDTFTVLVEYQKWSDEEEAQRLPDPILRFKDFPNTNPKYVEQFISQELENLCKEFEEAIGKDEYKPVMFTKIENSARNRLRAELREKLKKLREQLELTTRNCLDQDSHIPGCSHEKQK